MRSRKVTHGDVSASALDGAVTARAVVDGDGSLVEWNEGARRLLGWPSTEVVGRPAAELLASGGSFLPPPAGQPQLERDARTASP
ncbi:PAS domain-containing protein [Streptomyces vastus]|uniref:PAS domain-containing protein n=1 Tax=Streptomyces vastus TaxID=285451 RepID=A0ABP6CX70_9ACTN